MYVARFTFTPEYDAERNWSGWIGQDWATEEEALLECLNFSDIDDEEIESAWEKWQDESWRPWHKRDIDSRIDFLRDMADENGIDIRYNEAWGRWQNVHHAGLSCWPLSAETLDSAIKEARESRLDWHGFGSRTLGKATYLATLDNHLCIFECIDVSPETE